MGSDFVIPPSGRGSGAGGQLNGNSIKLLQRFAPSLVSHYSPLQQARERVEEPRST
jgi:hypothetical protein